MLAASDTARGVEPGAPGREDVDRPSVGSPEHHAQLEELLDRLDRAGIPRAVGSSSHHAWVEKILDHLGLRERFPIIVGGDDVAHGKPAPDIFLRCAELLGVPPERCAVIEDSANGVLAARRAGMAAIGLRTAATATLTLEGCLAIVDSFADCHAHLGLPAEP